MHYSLLVLLSLFLFFANNAMCQLDWSPKGWGTQLGAVVGLGTHNNRIGIFVRAFGHWEYVQVNIECAGFYQAKALGTEKQGWEAQLHTGLIGAWGKKNSCWDNKFIRSTSNQMKRPYSIGYGFNCYWDNQQTSQYTGTFALQVRQFHFLTENDFLAFSGQDKYRTGAFSFYYQQDVWYIALEHIAWTADPYAVGTRTIKSTPSYQDKAKYGYREMSAVPYAHTSAGILRLRILYHSPWANQQVGGSIGLDAEQIRNYLQNKLIHDSFLLKNPHIPMLDTKGNLFLYKQGQHIKKIRFYGDVLLNPLTLY